MLAGAGALADALLAAAADCAWSAVWVVCALLSAPATAADEFDCVTEPPLPGLWIRTEMLLLLGLTCVEVRVRVGRLAGGRDLLDALDRLCLRHAGAHGEQHRERAEERDQMSFHD